MSLVGASTNAILPILGVAIVDYLLARTTDIDVEPINTLGLCVLIPTLTFHSTVTATLGGGEVLGLGFGVVGYSFLTIVIARGVGRLAGGSDPLLGTLTSVAAFPNPGSVSILLSGFAFGEIGRMAAVIYLTIQNVVVYTLGVYITSNGSDADTLDAVTKIFRLPLLYVIVASVVVRMLGVVPPAGTVLTETVGLVGDVPIPVMLLILDIQLVEADVSAISWSAAPPALELAVAPFIGSGLVLALGFGDSTAAKALTLGCVTPAAIIPLTLIIEYVDETTVNGITASEYLSTTISTATIAGVGALTVLAAVLQTGTLF